MKLSKYRSPATDSRSAVKPAIWVFFLVFLAALPLASSAAAAPTPVLLATTDSFAVLAGAGITNTGPTTITGDVGTFPTTTIVGTGSLTMTETNHAGDAVTQQAKSDLVTAYDNAAGEGPTSPISADLAGQTLRSGIYNSASSIGLTGALTLDGGGDPDAVFVFQAGSTLITGSASRVNLINGAQSCNVFWQVGSSATLGTGSTFRGTLLALTSITVTTGVTVDGRVLARNGAVTLDTDTITRPSCAAPTTTHTTTTTTTGTTTTSSGTTTTAGTPTATAPPTAQAAAVVALVNASAAKGTATMAAAAAKVAVAKSRAAKVAATKAIAAAKVAAAKATAAKSQTARAAAVKVAAAQARAAKVATATATALAKVAAAKVAAANAAAATKRTAAKKLAAAAKSAASSTNSTQAGHALPARQHVGLTG